MRGRILCEQGNEKCLVDLRKATENSNVAIEACQIAYLFLSQRNRQDEADQWQVRASDFAEENHKIFLENTQLNVDDKLDKAQLSDEQKAQLIAKLQSSKIIKKAWLAKKTVEKSLGGSNIAIAFVPCGLMHISEEKVSKRVAEEFPEFDGWLIAKLGDHKHWLKKLSKPVSDCSRPCE